MFLTAQGCFPPILQSKNTFRMQNLFRAACQLCLIGGSLQSTISQHPSTVPPVIPCPKQNQPNITHFLNTLSILCCSPLTDSLLGLCKCIV
jgi:hypothetical protein